MRLQCEVEVLSRLLPTCGLRGRGRAARALLSLGRPPGAAGAGIYLMVCTARDRGGARYKVQQNVERLFTRFVEEGKATVRLREPAVDLCLSKVCLSIFLSTFKVSQQEVESYLVALGEVLWRNFCFVLKSKEILPANVINLKTFLSAVRLAHQGSDTGVLPLSPLVPAKNSDVEKPKTKMIITSRRDYPLTKSFPFSLEHLQTSYCKLARIDTRVLCLKKLRKLDLSHNHIKQLPATLGDLVCLQELDLHDNHLEAFSGALCSSGLQKSLQFLDLSQNQIQALPIEFCQLRGLVQLRLDDNALLRLPCRIGQLSHLRFLSAARNKLPFLPSDFRKLCLENLDLFGNPFEQPNPLVPNIQLKIPLTLLECAARATVNHRIPYGRHLLPSHLCKDLEVAKTCRCGSACLSSFIQITVTMNLHHVAHTVVLVDNMGGTEAPILCYFCSLDCYSQFLDRHLQSNG